MRYIFFLIILSTAAPAQTQVYTVETVPNVKVDSNNLVSNPDGILRLETVRKMDAQLKALEASTTAQVAVVAINSIGDQDIFNFAQELFTKWGIGQKSNDNGLLILLVLDQKTVRFHTGKGLEGILPDIVCKRIQEQDMVPLFKEEKNDEAMTAGVDHVVKVLTDPIYADEILAKELRTYSDWSIFFPITLGIGLVALLVMLVVNNKRFTDSKKPLQTPYGEMRMSRMGWFTEFGIVPVAILLVFMFQTVKVMLLSRGSK